MVISSTEFWGVTVLPGRKGLKVPVTANDYAMEYIHVNQAALGERPGPGKSVIFANVDGQSFALGTLEKGRTDMFQMEMIFDSTFRLYNTGKAPVYITGYRTQALDEDLLLEDDDDDDDDDEDSDDDDSDDDGDIPRHIELSKNGDGWGDDDDDDDDDDGDDDDDDEGYVDFDEDDLAAMYHDDDSEDGSEGEDDDDESDDDDDDESDDDDDDDSDDDGYGILVDELPPTKRSKPSTPVAVAFASPKKSPGRTPRSARGRK